MRRTSLLFVLVCLLLAPIASAGDDAAVQRMAGLAVHGTDAEQAAAAAWLEAQDEATIRAFLRAVRSLSNAAIVELRIRFLSMPLAGVSEYIGESATDDTSAQLQYLDAAEAAALVARAEGDERAAVATSRSYVRDRQRGEASRLHEVSYVKGFEVEKQDGKEILDPVVDTIQEGVLLDLTPTLSPDRRYVTLEIAGTCAAIEKPIREWTREFKGQEVTTQHPEVAVLRSRSTVRLPDGGSVLWRGPIPRFATEATLALITAQVTTPDAARSRARADAPPAPAESGPLHNIEARILDIPLKDAARLLGPGRPTADTPHHILDAEAAERLLRNVQATEGAAVVSSPRVTVYDGQKANVSMLNQVSFVQDYDIEVLKDGTQVADPIIGVLHEGITLDFQPQRTPDGKAAVIEFVGTWSVLQRPIPDKEVDVGGQTVTIQLPELDVAKARASVRVPDGGYVLLGGGVPFGKGDARVERVVLLHAKQIQLEELAPPK
jgi:hypothetical protein